MKIKELLNKVIEIEEEYDKRMKSLKKECEQFEGLSVKIPHGEYEGRWGKIKYVTLSNGRIRALIQPYRLVGKGDEVLIDTCDARTFWLLIDIKGIQEE